MSLSGSKWVAMPSGSYDAAMAIVIGTEGDEERVMAVMTVEEAEVFRDAIAAAIESRKALEARRSAGKAVTP